MTTSNPGERLGLLGRKVGMMRIFTDDGDAIPVTVLDVSNNRVTQIKTAEADGYSALQVAFGERKASRVSKPEAGHLAKAGAEAGEVLKEFRVPAEVAAGYKPGAQIPVGVFAVGPKGDLTYVGEEWTRGDYPRSFAFDPAGGFLYCCNQRADHVTVFRADGKTGGLAFSGQYVPVGNPSCVVFLDLAKKG